MKLQTDRSTVNIAGVQLPCVESDLESDNEEYNTFVCENGTSSFNNIQQLALAVSCNRPVLLQGPVGSGKTSTVEYLAYITGHKQSYSSEKESVSSFIKVQLGEQTDSRMLLGGYQSTEIPGKFVWKPGVLTNAVINGYWILLEDIDSTSSDVVTVIDNLIKNQCLSVPGFGDSITLHPQFHLFATQRTLNNDSSSVKYDVLKHWFIIQLKPLTSSELVGIINKRFPKLSCVANRMVSVLELEYPVQSSDRIPSARDLLKWCKRCSKYFETGSFDVSLRVFQDALDIFCSYMDKNCKPISEQIGIQLGIVKHKACFLNDRYKPTVSITEKKLIAGRSNLDRYHVNTIGLTRSQNMVFSLTAPTSRLIEKIACCLENNEPVLLVGETGCGKTTVLQYMARIVGRNLIVINMNQQSDTADLMGGFKPVTFRWVMKPLCDKFESLFRKLYNVEKNRDCLNKFLILFNRQNWDVLLKFIAYVQKRAIDLISFKMSKHEKGDPKYTKWQARYSEWEELGLSVKKFEKQCEVAEKSLIFSFIEGSLVKAVKRGDWVLLDEINLASTETLDCLSGLLEDSKGSILLLEKGESKPIARDSGFRLFAAMNPATDVGKKRLPVGLRNRFTEFYIEELNNSLDLYPLVETYLMELNYPPEKIKKIVNFYLKIKKTSKLNILDGNGKRPHYSLRNLCRALTVASKNMCGNPPRSLYEGLNLSFLTQLDKESYKLVHELVVHTATDVDIKVLLNQPIPKPPGKVCVQIEDFWIPVGNLQPSVPDNYILTDTVKRHLKDVIRITSLGSGIPILLEGDTSVGKTSLINYLAKSTGHFCARVNNHEHTDIQEYIGTYVADAVGKLTFKEGILCEAMRNGYWLILDELNLAPSEVLEALNRVLDDNRELFIPETQTVIKAHEKFMLFATQNPPGLYGGRKELSRAFKNRFIEIQFSQIPPEELVTILEKRCQMPLSYCKKMVAVMTDLQLRRRGSDIFIGKSGFITLRDLFRWGERYQKAAVKEKFYDWEQHLADEGYILLAGRVRLQEESKIIEEVITKHFKRKTNPHNLFSLHENTSLVSRKILETLFSFSKSKTEFKHIVWTYSMRRLAVLVCKAIEFSEPVLLVGETGCGKTTIVQILALLREQKLYSVNCHTHSESADFLGGLRPVREESRLEGKLFEWCDGPLIQAMTTGSFFLADEISLADDSVLERLNSLLEPERTILLTEKGGGLNDNESGEYVTVADENFKFIGTMNPGGDFGKKELSPALRNRFTEIWVEVNDNKREDYQEIMKFNLKKLDEPLKSKVSEIMVDFVEWFQKSDFGKRLVVSVRDLMTWIEFMNVSDLEWFQSCLHGCCLTFLDGLGCGTPLAGNVDAISKFRLECFEFLVSAIGKVTYLEPEFLVKFCGTGSFIKTESTVGIHPFYISLGKGEIKDDNFNFNASTTFSNTLRIMRGLQMKKAILLEGSPGVGKTSLVSSLAKASGHTLTRINLSDQTDISDLFGADLPEEGATAGHFVWKDGPFLTALKNGHWILLDELNLALQSVLEGLNAVLDHRGSAFIPELNKTFHISKETKLFACQNPLKEGGNRRGLPRSLLNRFTQVYVEPLSVSDYISILKNSYPDVAQCKFNEFPIIEKMVEFNCTLYRMVAEGKIGLSGGPWEFNLRDIMRWVEGILKACCSQDDDSAESKMGESRCQNIKRTIFDYSNLLYFSRFRCQKDIDRVVGLFESVFGFVYSASSTPQIFVTEKFVMFGDGERISRNTEYFCGDLNEFEMFGNGGNSFGAGDKFECREVMRLCRSYRGRRNFENLRLLEKQYRVLRWLSRCVEKQWLAILVGDHGTGKTSCVRVMAALANRKLRILSCNSATDTSEILGGFEQTDYNRHLDEISEAAKAVALTAALRWLRRDRHDRTVQLLAQWLTFSELPVVDASADGNTLPAFLRRLDFLEDLLRSELLDVDSETRNSGDFFCGKLEDLKERLRGQDCITSGGKFEWVDSVLIKCLRDGSWLLMEDVNLCSSAVLDRLNSLLEPDGCLTIGERGASADGSVFTIRPHKDFRLFFTMNPKNGVISRAMRNRGVEIFLMPDTVAEDWPILDRLAMISDVGITEMAMQTALMKFESSREVWSISNLIANSFWTAQYIKHGFDKSLAFSKSTQQIYKYIPEEGQQLIADLSTSLNSSKAYSISFVKPTLCNFLIDDGYARLKQSCGFLLFLTEVLKNHQKIEKVPAEDLAYFLGVRNVDLKISDGLTYSILYSYMVSGTSMCKVQKVVSNVLKGVKLQEDVRLRLLKLSETLAKIIFEDHIIDELRQLPWDFRWYEDRYKNPIKNKTIALLKFVFLLFRESRDDLNYLAKTMKKKENITVAEYSKAVQEGYMEDVLPDYPMVARYNILLDSFDEFITSYLKTKDVILDDSKITLILKSFKWRFCLGTMAKSVILSGSKRTVNEETLTRVELYFLWFRKCVLNIEIDEIAKPDLPETIMKKYSILVENVRQTLRSDLSMKLLKVSNDFRRRLGHPPPDKYLPRGESAMEVLENPPDYVGDSVILRAVLHRFVQYSHTRFIQRSDREIICDFGSLFALLSDDVKTLGSLLEEHMSCCDENSNRLSSEIMFHSLDILNSDHTFFDVLEDNEEDLYSRQILIFHRPVWTCRIINFLFRSQEKWNMLQYKDAERDLRNLFSTIIPQISLFSTPELDPLKNEQLKLFTELAHIEDHLKTILGSGDEELNSFLARKSQETCSRPEKLFFEKLSTIVLTISSIYKICQAEYYAFGCLWSLIGYLELIVLEGTRVDPIRRKILKASCAKMEVQELEPEIQTFALNSIITGTTSRHPYVLNLKTCLESSKQKMLKYNNLERVERDLEKFKMLSKEVNAFVNSAGQLVQFCSSVHAFLSQCPFGQRELKSFWGKARFIRNKTCHFINVLKKDLIDFFGDLTYPLLAAAVQIEHGVNLIMSELLRKPLPSATKGLINSFCSYPIPEETERKHPFYLLRAVPWSDRPKQVLEENKLLLLFSACRNKCNEWLTFRTDEKYDELIELFTIFVEFWKREEEKIRQKNLEEESLFIRRGAKKCETISEEEELDEEQAKLFPTYEKDFEEGQTKEGVAESIAVISPEQLSQVSNLHMKLVKGSTRLSWIPNERSNLSQDYLTPLKLRYHLLSRLLPHISFNLEYTTDIKLLPGLLVMMHAKECKTLLSEITLQEMNRIYDFYKDENVPEAEKCLEILKDLRVKCLELLNQWPEHPALVQMNIVIDRIMSFSIESPLMKFLTGLEILLQNCQHWESVAHSGVSISEHLIRLTNLIIEWRKLELQGWKCCFESARIRMNTNASKWWYHIWSLIEEYFSDEAKTTGTLPEVLQALYNFIETSPIGEFELRLDILLSFHYHLVRLSPSEKRDKLVVAFWNLYSFYNQYKSEVAKKLDNLVAPVVKKLKDYVKIAKWNDITYWSVKQAIEKSHRSLLKFIKEYEGILKQPVQLITMDPSQITNQKKQDMINQDISRFLIAVPSEELKNMPRDTLLVSNSDKKFEKAKKFCTDIILTSEYPNLILHLEYLSEQICESMEHFRDLDVDRTKTKQQQKSQAKSIVHLRRRALADLFKTLQLLGLSYRTGIVANDFGVIDMCDTVPLTGSDEEENSHRLSGEDYYLKTVSRRLMLENSLLTPSKDIGPAIIERLKGYAAHIMVLNKRQKFTLGKFEAAFRDFQRLERILTELTSLDTVIIPDQQQFFSRLHDLKSKINGAIYTLNQFALILKSWSSEGDKMKKMNFFRTITPEIMISSTFDNIYISTLEKFEEIHGSIKNLENSLECIADNENEYSVKFIGESFTISKNNFCVYYFKHIDKFNTIVEEFRNVIKNVREFKNTFVSEHGGNCLVDCLDSIGKITCERFDVPCALPDVELTDVCERNVSAVIENILLIIQRFIKKLEAARNDESNAVPVVEDTSEAEDEDNTEELLDNHLNKKLVESLDSDIRDLNLDHINNLLLTVMQDLTTIAREKGFFNLAGKHLRILNCTVPFVKQYSLLCSYFLGQQRLCYRSSNKLSSILIGTFIQVAQKGYCIPPEYEEEEGEGVGNQGSGGMGLGDGEGKTDVSDRIESEDQLEGAEQQGKEKDKQEDRDVKEEENGIDMSEDFEGKAQDIDKKNDNDESDQEEEEEPDVKEMGETEEGAEKLEKELWSSDEEGEEETEKKEEEGSGKGKQALEDKYAGKENEAENQDDDEVDEKQKKQKDDIDEINEQEENSDQIDPYHGHHPPEPEPEPFELPNDLNLDNDHAEEGEENPLEIDEMKEVKPPNQEDEENEEGEPEEKREEEMETSGDDEEPDETDQKPKGEGEQEETMEVDEEEHEKMDDSEVEKKESAQEEENPDEKEEEETKENQQKDFVPSDDTPSTQPAQPAPESEKDELASRDQVMGSIKQPEFETHAQEVTEKPRDESKGTGQAEVENMNEGHEVGVSNKEKLQPGQYKEEEEDKRKQERPGKSDEDRTLADNDLSIRKKFRTMDKLEEDKDAAENDEKMEEESELHQHIKENVEKASQVVDAATKEQAESQAVPNKEEDEAEKLKEDEVAMDVCEEETEKEVDELESSEGQKVKDMKKAHPRDQNEEEREEVQNQIEGENVETMTVERGPETTYHTNPVPLEEEKVHPLPAEEIESMRVQIQEQIQAINQNETPSQESVQAWQLINSVVEDLSRDLTEQLRLILEPSKATRLKGDYRTGRRINMRKIISYIASEFRKDSIWLRRTKPWKRDHEIILAIDDSSSMASNNSKELAFESLALVSKALGLLEAGQLGVLSFGEKTKVVHQLGDPFTEETGARLLKEFTFNQNKTLISEMLEVSSSMMTRGRRKGEVSQLLIIISDGRGVFSEGVEKIKLAVRRATDQGIFLVFVIVDEPMSNDSIMDIRMPEFKDGKFIGIKSYLEEFPFPYYLILRDINALPSTLGDALRQWFQLVTSTSPN